MYRNGLVNVGGDGLQADLVTGNRTEAEMLRSVLISKFTRSGWPKGI
jgi:hypothetical protein